MDIEINITNTYRTKDIAELLKISPSTIRKYAIAMIAAGAEFNHDAKNERLYDERDFKAFSLMRQQISEGSTMKHASIQAAALLQQERQARRDAGEVLVRSDRELIVSMAKKLEEQDELIRQLLEDREQLRKQNSLIISGQSRMEGMMQELLEQRANDARTDNREENISQEPQEKPEPKRRGLFGRIFGRG